MRGHDPLTDEELLEINTVTADDLPEDPGTQNICLGCE